MFKKEKADLHLQIQEHALPDILVVFQLARLQLVDYLFDRTGRFFLNVKMDLLFMLPRRLRIPLCMH